MGKYIDGSGLSHFMGIIKGAFVSNVSYDTVNKLLVKTKGGTDQVVAPLSAAGASGSYNDLSDKPTIPSANSTATNIKMDGTQSAGSLATFAKADHVHPSDTSRVPTTRTVNGKALSSNITLYGSDILVTSASGADQIDTAISNIDTAISNLQGDIGSIPQILSSQVFDGVKIADTGAVARFATCSTAASTAAKAITLTSPVTLAAGLIVLVKFTTTNTAAVGSLTLAITSPTSALDSTPTTTTAKPIKYRGANLGSAGMLGANRVYVFVYDGTNFELVGDLDTTYSEATTSAAGLMSASDKTKLNGIATGAEVNQNAFSNVKVGSTTVAADAKTDTLELAGSNVTLTPDATNDKVTIGITASNVTTALGNTAVARATGDASGNAIATTYAKLASPALTGTPTAPTAAAGTNSTQIATTAFVANAVGTATAGALQYKGTVDAESTITGAAYKKGWYYVVSTAGTYVGKVCEVGDMLIAKQDKTSTPANDWDAVQSNIEVLSNSEIDALWAAA